MLRVTCAILNTDKEKRKRENDMKAYNFTVALVTMGKPDVVRKITVRHSNRAGAENRARMVSRAWTINGGYIPGAMKFVGTGKWR